MKFVGGAYCSCGSLLGLMLEARVVLSEIGKLEIYNQKMVREREGDESLI